MRRFGYAAQVSLAERQRSQAKPRRPGSEFVAPLPLFVVALFAVNNHWLKQAWPGVVTGKLSDFAACFFLPLFFSALLGPLLPGRLRLRLGVGVGVTAVGFTAVKVLPGASQLLDAALSALTGLVGLGPSLNLVDPTDLVALPMLGVAYVYGARHAGKVAPFPPPSDEPR